MITHDLLRMTAEITALEQVLTEHGFTNDAEKTAAVEVDRNDPSTDGGSMSENGPYVVLAHYSKDAVTVLIERNSDGIGIYPPIAIVEGPKGRCAALAQDIDAVLTLANG